MTDFEFFNLLQLFYEFYKVPVLATAFWCLQVWLFGKSQCERLKFEHVHHNQFLSKVSVVVRCSVFNADSFLDWPGVETGVHRAFLDSNVPNSSRKGIAKENSQAHATRVEESIQKVEQLLHTLNVG